MIGGSRPPWPEVGDEDDGRTGQPDWPEIGSVAMAGCKPWASDEA